MKNFYYEDFLDLEFDIHREMALNTDILMDEFNKIMQEIEEIDDGSINNFLYM